MLLGVVLIVVGALDLIWSFESNHKNASVGIVAGALLIGIGAALIRNYYIGL